jgi:trimeric autotransporter adhesin
LSGTDASYFNIDASTGAVTLKVSANYEAKASYNFNVTAFDGTSTVSKAVTLAISNVNEAPAITSAASATINENSLAGTSVYTATSYDVDSSYKYFSLTGADSASFTINNSTGVVTINGVANYETKSRYDLVVNVHDGSLPASQALTINVTNLNEGTTGSAAITGTPTQGQILTAGLGTLVDLDGPITITSHTSGTPMAWPSAAQLPSLTL